MHFIIYNMQTCIDFVMWLRGVVKNKNKMKYSMAFGFENVDQSLSEILYGELLSDQFIKSCHWQESFNSFLIRFRTFPKFNSYSQ